MTGNSKETKTNFGQKHLSYLVQDIRNLVISENIPEQIEKILMGDPEGFIKNTLGKLTQKKGPGLTISMLGKPCIRQIYYTVREPQNAEPMHPSTRMKFLIGDMWETILLRLAKAAGHSVENEQMEVEFMGIKGHIDCTIDGELVDVKSASSLSFKRFENKEIFNNDAFGYLYQLGAYALSMGRTYGFFLVGDKTLGHITLLRADVEVPKIKSRVYIVKDALEKQNPPPRGFNDKHDTHGNRILGLECSYCQFKYHCWPGLRTFVTPYGPKYFTKIVSQPIHREIKSPQTQHAAAI